jgi:hypothetical protein
MDSAHAPIQPQSKRLIFAARIGDTLHGLLYRVRRFRDEKPLSLLAFTCGFAFLAGVFAGTWRSRS